MAPSCDGTTAPPHAGGAVACETATPQAAVSNAAATKRDLTGGRTTLTGADDSYESGTRW